MPLRLCSALLLACLGAVVARGQVTFTFTGTVTTPTLGYTAGAPVTFTMTMGPGGDSESASFGEGNYWNEEEYNKPALFVDITGTGLSDSFVRPGNMTETGLGDPFSYVITGSDLKTLNFWISNDKVPNSDNYGLGLTLPSGPTAGTFLVAIDVPNIDNGAFPVLSDYTDPATYFSSLAGTYEGLCLSTVTIFDTSIYAFADVPDPSHLVIFEISSMTISAIPEPSTYAAIFGAAALGCVGIRRFNRKRAEILKS